MNNASGEITGIKLAGGGPNGGYGFTDAFDDLTMTIYELKPNNQRSIAQGIAQLHRYADAYKKSARLILILY